MKKIIKLSILFFASALVLASCSKYEDNPAVSLKSKTGRLTGDWTLTNYEYTGTTTSSGTTTMTTVTYNGVIMTYSSGGYTETYSYSQKVTINDDGTFKMTEVEEGETDENTGSWSFLDGASEKEQLLLDGDLWVIKKLTNKELVLEDASTYTNIDGSYTYSSSSTTTLTFEKQ